MKDFPTHDDMTTAAAAKMAISQRIMEAVAIADQVPGGPEAMGEALCAALETVCGGAPRHAIFGDLREEARWWAEVATPLELEAYAAAALERIERATFAPRARKRLFMALWRGFTDDERQKFLNHVRGGDG
ncbi:MAG: hypothetical protein D6773_08640 [Alphaproteobacteria bacterium]|nr:MAG: hypothetical protein D6773_08640 [Alphaproteobacteria bacterium]